MTRLNRPLNEPTTRPQTPCENEPAPTGKRTPRLSHRASGPQKSSSAYPDPVMGEPDYGQHSMVMGEDDHGQHSTVMGEDDHGQHSTVMGEDDHGQHSTVMGEDDHGQPSTVMGEPDHR